MKRTLRPLEWVGSSLKDMKQLPEDVQDEFGHALYLAQCGEKHVAAKPLKYLGGGAGILEVVEDFEGNTYRAVYTVRFNEKIYVLHVFQKKSKSGMETPKQEMELIRARLKYAHELNEKLKKK
jgi:phage-related protein